MIEFNLQSSISFFSSTSHLILLVNFSSHSSSISFFSSSSRQLLVNFSSTSRLIRLIRLLSHSSSISFVFYLILLVKFSSFFHYFPISQSNLNEFQWTQVAFDCESFPVQNNLSNILLLDWDNLRIVIFSHHESRQSCVDFT